MKKTLYILIFMIGALVFSCTPDKYEVFDFESNAAQVDSIELAPNSHILYADGVSELFFRVHAFDINKIWRKDKVTLPDGTLATKDTLHTDIFRVQNSRITADIEFYKEDGTKLPANAKISTTTVEDFKIYAKIGDKQSEMYQIDVREPFPEKARKVIPVIFHHIKSEADGGSLPGVDTKYLQYQLDQLNAIFSKRAHNHSNGANANIEFKLALYAPDGTRLEEDGLNRVSTPLEGFQSRPALVENTWDPKKYMNVYISGTPNIVPAPHTKLTGVDPILGLSFTDIEADDDLDLSPEKIGITIGASYYGTYLYYISYIFNWKREFSKYLGVLNSYGEDHCDDTYPHGYNYSRIEGWRIANDGRVFYATNVTARSGQSSTFTPQQVERMHWVLENCPTHWAWKSDFAFTGVE